MPITALPTPPSRNDPTNFSTRADAFLGALPTFATEANVLQVDVNAKQVAANNSAVAAAASELAAAQTSGVTAWVSGTTYAVGNVRFDTTNFLTYRRKTTGAGTTRPGLDSTNWQLLTGLGDATLGTAQTFTGAKTFSGGLSYSGTLTGGTGVVDLGSGQFYKDASGNVGVGTSSTTSGKLTVATDGTAIASRMLTATASTQVSIQDHGAAIAFTAINYGPSYVGGSIFEVGAGGTALAQTANAPLGIGTFGVSQPLTFSTNSVERARIAADGQQFSVIPGGSVLYREYKCRAWVNFNGTGTVAIRASGNVSSITDNGVGDYTVNFTTAMPDANYAWVGSAQLTGANAFVVGDPNGIAPTSNGFRLKVCQTGFTNADAPYVEISVFR